MNVSKLTLIRGTNEISPVKTLADNACNIDPSSDTRLLSGAANQTRHCKLAFNLRGTQIIFCHISDEATTRFPEYSERRRGLRRRGGSINEAEWLMTHSVTPAAGESAMWQIAQPATQAST